VETALKTKLPNQKWIPLVFLIVGIICIAMATVTYIWGENRLGETITWNVTLIGSNSEQRILQYDEITAMPAYVGHGGFFTTVGVVNGPYEGKGVPLSDLCELVGGVTQSDIVMISAADGYSALFDYDQIMGDFITYNPENLKEVPHGELKLILMYKRDGKPLSDDDGKPLRLAVVGQDALLTEGLYWVKWVNRIEVMKVNPPGEK
jgi:DMSO/TMAO reductase YedYZ molybdopterin-dependent catalytic subunit